MSILAPNTPRLSTRSLARLLFRLGQLERDLRQQEAELAELVAGERDPDVLHHRAGQIVTVLDDLDWIEGARGRIGDELKRRGQGDGGGRFDPPGSPPRPTNGDRVSLVVLSERRAER